MDTELVRFRVNPELREQAAKVCAALGFELSDVLRALVTRIARDGALPFELSGSASPPRSDSTPFQDYDARLWSPLKPQVDAEVAITLLARFIADCSTRIDEESDREAPDSELMARLTQEREDARKLRMSLDVSDGLAIGKLIDKYSAMMRARAG